MVPRFDRGEFLRFGTRRPKAKKFTNFPCYFPLGEAHPKLSRNTNFNEKNMLRVNLILITLLWPVARALLNAPEGYEDSSGFHFA